MSKTIILTGASRGIGLAIARSLLSSPTPHNLILISRNIEPLKQLESAHVVTLAGDLSDFSLGQKAVDLAIERFGKLDSLIVNHGTLGEVRRVADCTVEGWQQTFDVNFFGVLAIVKASIPALRQNHGRIVFTSSGAALNAYSTWGAYGASKAALNHLCTTLENEEKDVTCVSVRPGVVDSEMQREIREVHAGTMDEKDRVKFLEAKSTGGLLRPEQPGNVIARLSVGAPRELGGKFLSWNDETLKTFQD